MVDEGYDIELLQEVSGDLYCVICLKLMKNPVQFQCGHGMCYGCFKSMCVKARQRNRIVQCPQCREIVRENQAISNVMLHRLILSLQVQCANEQQGCVWIGELSELEEHLSICKRGQSHKKSPSKQQKSKRNVVGVPDTLQSNLILNVFDSLSSLHTKIDNVCSKLNDCLDISSNEKKEVDGVNRNEAKSCEPTSKRKHPKKLIKSPRYFRFSLFRKMPNFFGDIGQNYDEVEIAKFLGIVLFILVIVIYLLTAIMFSSFESHPRPTKITRSSSTRTGTTFARKGTAATTTPTVTSTSKTTQRRTPTTKKKMKSESIDEYAKRLPKYTATSSVSPDTLIGLVDEMRIIFTFCHEYFSKVFNFIFYHWRYELLRLQIAEQEALQEIQNFYAHQNRTILELDKQFRFLMERSRIEINKNITAYDKIALKKLSVDNVQSLTQMAEPIFATLSTRIFENINFAHHAAVRQADEVYVGVRQKLWNVRRMVEFLSEYSLNSGSASLYEVEVDLQTKRFEELRDNITRSYKTIDKDKILALIEHDFFSLRVRYEHILNNYHFNISRVLTQEQRFLNLMHNVQNVDLRNGRFVWKLDALKISNAHLEDVFRSKQFQSGSSGKGQLFLYKDKERAGEYFQITFAQDEINPLNSVSIMSQIRPEVLICIQVPYGKSLPMIETSGFVHHYMIPMNMTELKAQGFVGNEKMFVRVITEDHRN